jgi:hypothetical protein
MTVKISNHVAGQRVSTMDDVSRLFFLLLLLVLLLSSMTLAPGGFLKAETTMRSSAARLSSRGFLFGVAVVAFGILWTTPSQFAAAQEQARQVPLQRPLQYNKQITKLGDDTFEHQTQASTGQTTGSWLVWFYTTGDQTIIGGEMPDPDFFEERNVVVAAVHGALARETSKRFGLADFPCLLYFSRRKMFRYRGELEWDAIMSFLSSVDAGAEEGEPVPPPRSEFAKMMELLHKTRVTHLLAASMVLVIILFVIYARIVAQSMERIKEKAG